MNPHTEKKVGVDLWDHILPVTKWVFKRCQEGCMFYFEFVVCKSFVFICFWWFL